MKKSIFLYILSSCMLVVSCAQKLSPVKEAKAFYTQVLPGRAMADESGHTINPPATIQRFIYLGLTDTVTLTIETILYDGRHLTAILTPDENEFIKIGTLASNGEMLTLKRTGGIQRWLRLDLQDSSTANRVIHKHQTKIIVKGKENVSAQELANELEGVMRSIRKLSPTEDDNFSLNQISSFSDKVSSLFGSINIGGWAIGILSLVVGAFGIANIMFVTVKERTPIIGLKKAIGAKKRSILSEFLLESAIICILGGLIGLILVYLLTVILTNVFNFPVYISAGILALAISICIIIGILSGIIPALSASRLDPVVAIRS